MVISLNCGNIWDDAFLDRIIALNNEHVDVQVTSLYGSLRGVTPTARSYDRLPVISPLHADKYIRKAQDNDIAIRYTINTSCIGALQDFLRDWRTYWKQACMNLHDIGVREWTVTSPCILSLLREMFPSDHIEVSTICEVSTPREALMYARLGASAICVSTSINRDFNRLRNIWDCSDMEISILANEACLWGCPWRRECYNLSSHNSERAGGYPFAKCQQVRLCNPVEWLKSRMVLPQWMKNYANLTGISHFKVSCRTHPYHVAVPIIEAYMSQDYKGNLVSLWPTISPLGNVPEPKVYIDCDKLGKSGFLSHFVTAGHNCGLFICGDECNYCGEILEEVM